MEAHNVAGTSDAEFSFVTLTKEGGILLLLLGIKILARDYIIFILIRSTTTRNSTTRTS